MWPPDGHFHIAAPAGDPIFVAILPGYGPIGQYDQPPAASGPVPSPLVTTYTQSISAAGNTTLWTPGAGNRYWLAGFQIFISANASTTAGATDRIQLTDGAGGTVIFGWQPFIPNAAGTAMNGNVSTGPVEFGMPFQSGALARLLVVNVTTALATGTISISTWGFLTTY